MEKCCRIFADSGQINNCKKIIEANQHLFTELSQVLSLAGNEARLKILFLLYKEKELCPCDISDILEMTGPAISQHLRKLKDGDIIKSRKTGQTIYYSLCNSTLLLPFFKLIDTPIPSEIAGQVPV
jgi:DNA-binding transcriptional ArsR family regulator